jgi:hypothetical protein
MGMPEFTSFLTVLYVVGWASSFSMVPNQRSIALRHRTGLDASASLVVVSPPGGIGEVSAVKAAELGASVRWFVVSSALPNRGNDAVFRLSPEALNRIDAAGGSIQVAGSDAASLLLPVTEQASNSAVQAVSAWCGPVDCMVCTLDGANPEDQRDKLKRKPDEEDPTVAWKNAIKVAAREASKQVSGTKIAILSTSDSVDMGEQPDGSDTGILDKVTSLWKGKTDIPSTLPEAIGSQGMLLLRHGQLFGTPESSPNFSALVGGLRKVPELCEEYANRAIRVDPTLTVAGNYMMGQTTRSSRHAVGEAAAHMSLGLVPLQAKLDVCVSSQTGTDLVTLEEWKSEFQRVASMVSSGQAAQLFSADFSSVPDTERLADWLNTKWAPAVLRTYDIAAIRTGARPVSASRTGPGQVEIVWQQLVNFDTATVGRMIIQVNENGMLATRGPGDPTKGFGSISGKPLAGEDVLVRRLAEAASQAIEKGLAKKVCLCWHIGYVPACPAAYHSILVSSQNCPR